jgi:hypothetical protein
MPLLTELSEAEVDLAFSGSKLGTEGSRGREGRPTHADVTATARALPALTSWTYEFGPKRFWPLSVVAYDRSKLRAYASAGVKECWLVLGREKQIEVNRQPCESHLQAR